MQDQPITAENTNTVLSNVAGAAATGLVTGGVVGGVVGVGMGFWSN